MNVARHNTDFALAGRDHAALLGVPIIATEQVPNRMGGTDPGLAALFPQGVHPIPKASFGCVECPDFIVDLKRIGAKQAVIVGIETHICVSQTALGLIDLGLQVTVCPDAVSARDLEMHKLGMERMRDAGASPAHTEAVVYEWLETAENPLFKQALEIVKRFAPVNA